jgi:hypothetical protein
MYRVKVGSTTANLVADNPLLLAGLERAARLADIEVVANVETAALSLRSEGSGTPHSRLDVVIDQDHVVVSMHAQPSVASWDAIFKLLETLTGEIPPRLP